MSTSKTSTITSLNSNTTNRQLSSVSSPSSLSSQHQYAHLHSQHNQHQQSHQQPHQQPHQQQQQQRHHHLHQAPYQSYRHGENERMVFDEEAVLYRHISSPSPVSSSSSPSPSSSMKNRRMYPTSKHYYPPSQYHQYQHQHHHPINSSTLNSSFEDHLYDDSKMEKKTNKNERKQIIQRVVLGGMIVSMALWLWWNYGEYLTLKSLRIHHRNIDGYVQQYPYTGPLLYILIVVVVVGLTLPGATVLSMAAGLIFQQPWASLYAWMGCGLGACACYGLVKSIFADCLRRQVTKHSDWFRSFENGLRTNELLYLIYARYMIIIPFWFVNVAAALLEVSTKYFIISTFTATIPGALLYTTAGRGLAHAFELYQDHISTWTLFKQVLFTNDIQYCLLALLFCGAIPISIKYYNKHSLKQHE